MIYLLKLPKPSYAFFAVLALISSSGVGAARAADPMILSQNELDFITAGATVYTEISLSGSGLPAYGKGGSVTRANSRDIGGANISTVFSLSWGVAVAPSTEGTASADADGDFHYTYSRVTTRSGRYLSVTVPISFAVAVDVSRAGS